MSGRKCISILMIPSPWQASQRPPLTLKLKRPGPYPRTFAFGNCANSVRIWLNMPVYVAGFERGVRPIGDWTDAAFKSGDVHRHVQPYPHAVCAVAEREGAGVRAGTLQFQRQRR